MIEEKMGKPKEVKYLNRKLEQAEQEKRKYSSSIKLLQKEVADQAKALKQLTETNTQLKGLYNGKEKEFFDFMKSYKDKEAKFNEEKKMHTEAMVALQAQLEDQKKVVSQLSETNSQLKALYNNKEREVFDFMNDFKDKEAKFNEEKKMLAAEIEMMQEQTGNQRTVIEALEELKRSLNTDNTRLRDEIKTLKSEHEKEVSECHRQIEQKDFIIAQLKENNMNLGLDVERLKAESDTLKSRLDESQKSVDFVERLQLRDYFKGEIVNGLKHGDCEERSEAYHFAGKYDHGTKHGLCTLVQGDVELRGNFENDQLHGEGTYKDLKSQKVLQGTFNEGSFTGSSFTIGKVTYNGQIKDNKANGSGYFDFTNDFIYEGKFEDDKPAINSTGLVLIPSTGEELSVEVADEYLLVEGLGVYTIDYESGELKTIADN